MDLSEGRGRGFSALGHKYRLIKLGQLKVLSLEVAIFTLIRFNYYDFCYNKMFTDQIRVPLPKGDVSPSVTCCSNSVESLAFKLFLPRKVHVFPRRSAYVSRPKRYITDRQSLCNVPTTHTYLQAIRWCTSDWSPRYTLAWVVHQCVCRVSNSVRLCVNPVRAPTGRWSQLTLKTFVPFLASPSVFISNETHLLTSTRI